MVGVGVTVGVGVCVGVQAIVALGEGLAVSGAVGEALDVYAGAWVGVGAAAVNVGVAVGAGVCKPSWHALNISRHARAIKVIL